MEARRLVLTERRDRLVDKRAGAVADGGVEDEDESASGHEGDISERSVRDPGIFGFHRGVAKAEDESHHQERREADQAAKSENEKRGDNPKDDEIRAG
jgi:hypothetical protein